MRARSEERTAGRSGARQRRLRPPRAAFAVLLAGALACSDGGGDGRGFLSFARREAPPVPDVRLSAGSGTDRLVLDGATAERVADFELTRARIDRWLLAQEYLSLMANNDPTVAQLIDGGGPGDAVRDPALAIDMAIERLEGHAPVRDALARVGTSPAEFVLTGLAMHQAFLASSAAAPDRLRRLAARNLRVMQRHEALFQRGRALDPQQLAYFDSLGWYYPGYPIDTTAASGAVYDPWAYDTLAQPDTAWDSLPPLDTLAPTDRATTDSLPPVRLPRDTARPPVLPPPPPPPVLPPARDSTRPPPVTPVPAPRLPPDTTRRPAAPPPPPDSVTGG